MGMARPVLGVIACQRTVGVEPAQAVMERYVRAVMAHADVAALIVPSLPELMSAGEVVDRLDGILLTGSPSNIEARHYRGEGGEGPFDPGRDGIALGLIAAMIAARRPVFGICRGFQQINVALGGTLRRDTAVGGNGLLRHHAPPEVDFAAMFDHAHPVELVAGGVLAKALDKRQLRVNSVHFQGIDRLAPGLICEAQSSDGLIEGFTARPNDAPVIAVQWHPEWDVATNPDSQAFFRLLGSAIRGVL